MSLIASLVVKAVEQYNKYRSPEATAEIVSVRDDVVEIDFRGPFCYTCGVLDWIEDLIYEALDLGLKLKIINIKDVSNDVKRVMFKIESPESSRV